MAPEYIVILALIASLSILALVAIIRDPANTREHLKTLLALLRISHKD